jgi:hypothetical protein
MPKIFEYLGIVIFFYSNEHEPIHVHGKLGEYENKAEFIIKSGRIVEIRIKQVGNSKPLKANDLRNFNQFLSQYGNRIVEKWIEYFILKKKVSFEKITKRLK